MNARSSATTPTPAPTTPTAATPAGSALSRRWLVDLVLLGALWGASFRFMRIGGADFGALPTAALRVAIGALVLLPLMLAKGHWGAFAARWKPTLAVGVMNSGLPFALFAIALLTINSGLAAVINATTPMFGALVAWAWFRERPDNWRLVGLVVGFAGVAALASRNAGLQTGQGGGAAMWATLACLGACASYGIAASMTRRYLMGMPSLATAGGTQIGATLFLVLPALWLHPTQMPSLRAWLAVAALGIACTGLAYILLFRLIETAGPARALTVTFLVPVFAIIYGWIFLGEQVTPWMLGCAGVIVCGVALSTGFVKPGRGRRAAP